MLQGRVINSNTGKGIARVSIRWDGSEVGAVSDTLGNFTIRRLNGSQLTFGAVGYERKKINVDNNKDSLLSVVLMPISTALEEVTVSRKNKKFKDPALGLIEKVIAHKSENHYSALPQIRFNEYEKLQFGVVDTKGKLPKAPRPFQFLFENRDSTLLPGKTVIPFYLEENYSDIFSSHRPDRHKKVIIGHEQTDLDPRFFNNDNWQTRFQAVLRDVDIYENTIQIINQGVLSPIANTATAFYRYTIKDTVKINGESCIELEFRGKSAVDLLFSGTLWISDDTRYAVHQAKLSIGKGVNLNWINDIEATLHYTPYREVGMVPQRSDLKILFGSGEGDLLYGIRESHYLNHQTDEISDSDFAGIPVEKRYMSQGEESVNKLADLRPYALRQAEQRAYRNVDSLQNMRKFKSLMTVGYLLAKGYYNAGKVEFGPLEYTYSHNNYEGSRVRISGRTTRVFSEKAFLQGYLAYGEQDRALKYFLSTAFTLNGERIVQFPANYLRFTVQHDVMEPGRNLSFLKGDTFFQLFRRNKPDKWQLNDIYQVDHLIEFGNHVSVATAFTHTDRTAKGNLFYVNSRPAIDTIPAINTNDLQVLLRWAPNEEFTYRNLERGTIENKYPIFALQYNRGLKGFWNADYNYDALRFSIFKRFFLSPAGRADMELSGGRIWGKNLPYTLLEIADAYKDNGGPMTNFDLMTNMEFISDQYLKLTYYQNWNGFFFNRIPLLKRLKWREVTGVKMFYGRLSDRNNPYMNPGNIQFDRDEQGVYRTRLMADRPYLEGIVGIDNVFKLLKLEYKRRLNYLASGDIARDTYGVSVHLNF